MNDCCALLVPVTRPYILVHTSGDKQSKSPNTFFSAGHSKVLVWSTVLFSQSVSRGSQVVDLRAVAIALWRVKDMKPWGKPRDQRCNGIESMRASPSYMQFVTGFQYPVELLG